MCKLRPERFRHVFNAVHRVNSGDRTWTPVPLLQNVLSPPSPSVAEVHGKMTGVFSSRWVPPALCQGSNALLDCPQGCVSSPLHILAVRGLTKVHMRWIFTSSLALIWKQRPAIQVSWDSRHLSWRKHIILQRPFQPLCTCQSWKKGKKKKPNLPWTKLRCWCVQVFLLLPLLK